MPKIVYVVFTILIAVNGFAVTLEEAVKKSLETHPDVKSKEAATQVKEENIRFYKGGYYPSVNITAGYGYEHTRTNYKGADDSTEDLNRTEARISLRQPIFKGFETVKNVSKSQSEFKAQSYELLNTKEQLAMSVCNAYINLLKTKAILELSKENLVEYERIKGDIEEKYKQGVSNLADWSQIRGRTANAKVNLMTAQQNYDDAQTAYRVIVGENPDSPVELGQVSTLPNSLENLMKKIYENPKYKAYRYQIDAAKKGVEASKSNFYPKLYVDLSQDYYDNDGGVEGDKGHTQAMLKLEYNLFDGFKDDSRKNISRYQWNQVSSEKAAYVKKLKQQAEVLWVNREIIQAQMPLLKEHVATSIQVKKLYEDQYGVGRRSLLDMLSSDIEVFNAQTTLVSSKYKMLLTEYQMLALTGELLGQLGVESGYTIK